LPGQGKENGAGLLLGMEFSMIAKPREDLDEWDVVSLPGTAK